VLLMRPRREWGAILSGVALGMGVGEWLDGNALFLEIWLRAISVLEVFLTAWLLPPLTNLDDWMRKPKIFRRFTVALLVGPGVSGILAAVVFHLLQQQGYLSAFNGWATADALGIAATMPFVLALRSPEMRALFRRGRVGKTVLILAGAVMVLTVSLSVSRYPLLFLVYPTLLLVDLVLGFAGASIAAVGLCLVAIYMTMHGYGAFGVWPPELFVTRDVALQAFLGFHLLALLPASVLIRERKTLVEDLNSSNEQLLMLASLDGLTGISNRRSLDETFGKEWKRAMRLKMPLALVMLDVDLFKGFNDHYGHHAGDECLRKVAQALSENVRRAQDEVGRFGGEEFILLLPHTNLAGAEYLAEKARAAILELRIPHAGSPWEYVTVSVGCSAMTPSVGMSHQELLKLADAALYEAKKSGRNYVVSKTENGASAVVGQG
jgi:diguanylate cyclase (GGDEF)-like protein